MTTRARKGLVPRFVVPQRRLHLHKRMSLVSVVVLGVAVVAVGVLAHLRRKRTWSRDLVFHLSRSLRRLD